MERALRISAPTNSMQGVHPHPLRWLFDPQAGPRNRFLTRWIFLRALAAIYFSAFYPLLFQIKALNGPNGILPAAQTLAALRVAMGPLRYWYAPYAVLALGELGCNAMR